MHLHSIVLLSSSFLVHAAGSANGLLKRDNTHARKLSEIKNPKVVERIRQNRGERAKRDLSDGDYSEVDHLSGDTELDVDEVFMFQEYICLLQPEADFGPFYISNADGYAGIWNSYNTDDVYLSGTLEIYDVNSCKPVSGAMVEFWHCNARGEYSGIFTPENGNGTDLRNETFGRGLGDYLTDQDGTCYLDSTIPGYIDGRAPHISYAVHINGVYDDHTAQLSNSTICHVGELYFDQALLDSVYARFPYSENPHELTLNSDDNQLKLLEGLNSPDPFFTYYIGGDMDDQLGYDPNVVAWAAIGVNVSASYDPKAIAEYSYSATTSTTIKRVDKTRYANAIELDYIYTTPAKLTGDVEIPSATVLASSLPYVPHMSDTRTDTYVPSYPTQYFVKEQGGSETASVNATKADVEDASANSTTDTIQETGASGKGTAAPSSTGANESSNSDSITGSSSSSVSNSGGSSSDASNSNGQASILPNLIAVSMCLGITLFI